jgi:hypothetical protein
MPLTCTDEFSAHAGGFGASRRLGGGYRVHARRILDYLPL